MLGDFIADAPKDDGRMVAVTADECAKVFFVPVRKKKVVVVSGLAANPAIERFVHDDEAETIGDVEQFGSRRVVARANRVAAHLFKDFELSFERAGVDGGAERAEIVMIANAVERNALAVKEEAVIGGKFDRANAERSFATIDYSAALRQGRNGDITGGIFDVPKFGLVYRYGK